MMKTRGMTNRRRMLRWTSIAFLLTETQGIGGNHFDKKYEKNKLLQICQLFSSIDFFWKKECTGGTRLMRKER